MIYHNQSPLLHAAEVIFFRRDWLLWTQRRFKPGYKNKSWRRNFA